MTKASIFVNYKRHTAKFSSIERSEEASFDTDQSSFIKEAATLLDVLEKYVTDARARRRS